MQVPYNERQGLDRDARKALGAATFGSAVPTGVCALARAMSSELLCVTGP